MTESVHCYLYPINYLEFIECKMATSSCHSCANPNCKLKHLLYPAIDNYIKEKGMCSTLQSCEIIDTDRLRRIGFGTFGTVYDLGNGATVVKVIRNEIFDKGGRELNKALEEFMREYNMWNYVCKENNDDEVFVNGKPFRKKIVECHGLRLHKISDAQSSGSRRRVGSDQTDSVYNETMLSLGIECDKMEYDLKNYIAKLINTKSYGLKEVVKIMIQMVENVSYLHEVNVLHNDIAMRNFLVDADDNVLISDFGMTRKNHSFKNRFRSTKKTKDRSNKQKRDIEYSYESIYQRSYLDQSNQKRPFRWCAVEVLVPGPIFFTRETDIYQLGCALSEVVMHPKYHYRPFQKYSSMTEIIAVKNQMALDILEYKEKLADPSFKVFRNIIMSMTQPIAEKRAKLDLVLHQCVAELINLKVLFYFLFFAIFLIFRLREFVD